MCRVASGPCWEDPFRIPPSVIRCTLAIAYLEPSLPLASLFNGTCLTVSRQINSSVSQCRFLHALLSPLLDRTWKPHRRWGRAKLPVLTGAMTRIGVFDERCQEPLRAVLPGKCQPRKHSYEPHQQTQRCLGAALLPSPHPIHTEHTQTHISTHHFRGFRPSRTHPHPTTRQNPIDGTYNTRSASRNPT